MTNQGKELYEFGPFRLDSGKRLLLRDNTPVPLQLKAFDTLLVLVRNSEQVVLKDDLMKAVWPDTFVEESNLAQNIFVLRKTLGATVGEHRYIVTVPGRGYRFAEKVRIVSEEESLVVESHSRSRVVIEETKPRRTVAISIVGIVFFLALGVVVGYRYHRPQAGWTIRCATSTGGPSNRGGAWQCWSSKTCQAGAIQPGLRPRSLRCSPPNWELAISCVWCLPRKWRT